MQLSQQSISKFLSYYRKSRSQLRKRCSGRRSKVTLEVMRLVKAKLLSDNETTATQLQQALQSSCVNISLTTVKRHRRVFGWGFHGSRCTQMIREPNRVKRLEWCLQRMIENDGFNDVIWSLESSIRLKSYCSEKDQNLRLKRSKCHVTVHVWAGISRRGATRVAIFEGKMKADFCVEILRRYLVPFIQWNSLQPTDSCRTMILGTLLERPSSSSDLKTSIGGRHHRNLPISTQSTISGKTSKSTYTER